MTKEEFIAHVSEQYPNRKAAIEFLEMVANDMITSPFSADDIFMDEVGLQLDFIPEFVLYFA